MKSVMLAPRKPINQSKIPFAIKKSDGEIVSIDDVPAGLACDCVCPGCHADLVGKKGMQGRTHHFAHYKASQDLCQFAALTSIRLMLLAELTHKRHPGVQAIALPDITGEVTAKDSVRRVTQNYREPRPVRHAYIHQQNNLFPQILLTLNPTTQPENEAVCIGLYLPQVNPKNEQPDWLGAYVTTWPQRGLLEVHYTTLYAMLFERAIETPVTECLLHSLFTSKRALRWLYHPDEGAIRRNKEERLIRDLTEANERRRRLQAEARRQMGGTTGKQGGRPGEQSSPWPSHCAWGLECRFCGQLIVNPSSAQICD